MPAPYTLMPAQPVSSEQFTKHIQRIVTTKSMSYLDAVLYFCEQRRIEPEVVAPLLGDKIKSEISEDAMRLHLIPRTARLPF